MVDHVLVIIFVILVLDHAVYY